MRIDCPHCEKVIRVPEDIESFEPLSRFECVLCHKTVVIDDCMCEFDPYEDSDEESWHYRRVCRHCGCVWWALHCPHDGAQNDCPGCGVRPETVEPR